MHKFLLIAAVIFFAFLHGDAWAKDADIFMPTYVGGRGIIVVFDEMPPLAPNIVDIQFLKFEPPHSLDLRIGKLVQGITVDIPPEFDYYGYEIRRYMQAVGSPEIYSDKEMLKKQIVNVKKARVILSYWRKELELEISDIRKILEVDASINSGTRAAFAQNEAKARNFTSIMQAWMDKEMAMLKFLFENQDDYTFTYPKLTFKNDNDGKIYFRLLSDCRKTVKELREHYSIFGFMVY